MSKFRTLAYVACITSLFAVPASLLAAGHQTADPAAQSLFRARCASCHGVDGRADTAIGKSLHVANLHSAAVQHLSSAEIKYVISNGKGNMPPFGSLLTPEQIQSLVKYVHSLGKSK